MELWRRLCAWLARDLIETARAEGYGEGWSDGQADISEHAYSYEDMQESYDRGRHYERHGN